MPAPSVHATVDTTGFADMARGLSKLSGTAMWPVLLSETGRVLEACVRGTTRDASERITRSIEFKNRELRALDKSPIISITKRGVIWYVDEPGFEYEGRARGRKVAGKTFHPMTEFFHYSDARWQRYQAALVKLKEAYINPRDVIGRAAHSWVQIADSLGLTIEAPEYVRRPQPFHGHIYANGSSRRTETADTLFVDIFNANPVLLNTIDGNRILQRAINGRIEYFRKNMETGVFNDLKTRAERYRGVFVQ